MLSFFSFLELTVTRITPVFFPSDWACPRRRKVLDETSGENFVRNHVHLFVSGRVDAVGARHDGSAA